MDRSRCEYREHRGARERGGGARRSETYANDGNFFMQTFHCFVAFRNLHSSSRAPHERPRRATAQSRARGARGRARMFVRARVFGTLGALLGFLALIPPWCVPAGPPLTPRPLRRSFRFLRLRARDDADPLWRTQVPRVRLTGGVPDRGRDRVGQRLGRARLGGVPVARARERRVGHLVDSAHKRFAPDARRFRRR